MAHTLDGGSRRFNALIVDFGGVLTTPLQDAMQEFASELGLELQDLARVALAAYAGSEDSLVTDFETGRISEEEFSVAFAARLTEESGRPVPAEGLVKKLFRMRLEEPMFEAVAAAKAAGFRTGLLSNSWGTDAYPRHRFPGVFDEVVISGEVGMRKPDPAIFELISEKIGVPPKESVFVDDHPGHLQAALEQGMTTVLHRSPVETIAELEGLLGVTLS
jgi:epoxide hydrolase-like predicted phosphatase